MQWLLHFPAVVPGYLGSIRGMVGICVGCLIEEVDSDVTDRQRLDRFTDLLDRQTVSVMRQMGTWTRAGDERPTEVVGRAYDIGPGTASDPGVTIESEMNGIIALSSRVDDRFRDSARIVRPVVGEHRIRPIDDGRRQIMGRREATSVIYRVEPYDSDIGHIIEGGFRRRDA